MELDCEEFLELVWGEDPGWVDLPAKVGEYWVPWYHDWEGDAELAITNRIDTCLRDRESLYFSVCKFSEKGRSIENVLPGEWLFADLDAVSPTVARNDGLMPTLAWESSPGRFQALWHLDRELRPKVLEKLNRGLSYHLGADFGGWDLTQVLRLPGTRNFKYESAPPVTLMWAETGRIYNPREVWAVVKGSLPREGLPAGEDLRDAGPMPAIVKALLRAKPEDVVEGERSEKLWRIECALCESGWSEDAIFAVVCDSAWNKWRTEGITSWERRLRADISKAARYVRAHSREHASELGGSEQASVVSGESEAVDDLDLDSEPTDTQSTLHLPWVGYSSFMAMRIDPPRWLVEDIWTAGSHGVIGGEPKTSKTTLTLGLGLAIASGKPFLGQYRVRTPGPVLLVQEENAQVDVQDKLQKLAWHSGLLRVGDVVTTPLGAGALGTQGVTLDFPDDVPLRLLNNWGFDLTDAEHREALEEEIQTLRPVALMMDPLYLMLPGVNLDKGYVVTPYLKWLLGLRNEYGCAVIVNHHMGKSSVENSGRRAGQRLMGSALFHGWVDCALYTSQVDLTEDKPGWVGVHMEREFRSMQPQGSLDISMFFGKPGDIDTMEVLVEQGKGLSQVIVDMVTKEPGTTARKVADALGIDIKVVVGRARDAGLEIVSRKHPKGMSYVLSPNGDSERHTS